MNLMQGSGKCEVMSINLDINSNGFITQCLKYKYNDTQKMNVFNEDRFSNQSYSKSNTSHSSQNSSAIASREVCQKRHQPNKSKLGHSTIILEIEYIPDNLNNVKFMADNSSVPNLLTHILKELKRNASVCNETPIKTNVKNNCKKRLAKIKIEPLERQNSENYNGQSKESELPVDLFSSRNMHIKPIDITVYSLHTSKSPNSKINQATHHQKIRGKKEKKPTHDTFHQRVRKENEEKFKHNARTHKRFRNEIERILSFANFPRDAKMSALLLAANGFIYNGSGKDSERSVQCFFCGTNKKLWEWFEGTEEAHKESCEMNAKNNCINKPFALPIVNQSYKALMKTSRKTPNASHSSHFVAMKSKKVQFAKKTFPKRATVARSLLNSNIVSLSRFSQEHLDVTSIRNESAEATNLSHFQPSRDSAYENSYAVREASPQQSTITTVSEHLQREDVNTSTETTALTTSSEISGRITQETPRSESTASQSVPVTSLSTDPNQVVETPSAESSTGETVTQSVETSPVPVTSGNTSTTTVTEGSVTTSTMRPNNGTSPTYEQLAIITERPKRPEYALKLKRAETYASWPRDHHITTEELVNAGFYYAGYGDCTRCFYCGGGLRNWEDEDNVWVEHARWFPRCAYIRQQMGQIFVDTVQNMNTEFDKITMEMVKQRLGVSSGTFHLDSLNIPLKRDPAVQSVTALGYLEKDVLEMTQLIQQEGNTISSDLILEKLQNENKRRNQSQRIAILSAIDTSKATETIRQLKEKNAQLRQQTNCKICMESEVAVVFLPCGHLVSCSECASAMRNCPLCRVPVRGIVRAFMG